MLDGSEPVLGEEFLLIADESKALALAGVMGGYDSRVTDATRNVFLESAHFAPAALMGRARKLGMHTDASHRFERGVDPELPGVAIERASALLIEIAGGRAGPIVEAVQPDALPKRLPIDLRRTRLARVLDLEIPDADVVRILAALGISLLLLGLFGRGLGEDDTKALVAFALFVTAIVFGVATISNDNLQDLKTGQLVGATPWRQFKWVAHHIILGMPCLPHSFAGIHLHTLCILGTSPARV